MNAPTNSLITAALYTYNASFAEEENEVNKKARLRAKECFGGYAEENLENTDKPGLLRIKGTNWNLSHGLNNCFTLWHKDVPDQPDFKNLDDCRCDTNQIFDLVSLGKSLSDVSQRWGW